MNNWTHSLPLIHNAAKDFLFLQSKTLSDALLNLSLRSFNFPVIFMMIKKMKKSYWRWTQPCNFFSVTLPFARVNMFSLIKLLVDINAVKTSFYHYEENLCGT